MLISAVWQSDLVIHVYMYILTLILGTVLYIIINIMGCDQPRQHIKKQRYCFANKGPSSQRYDFSSSHVWMWELDYKESWAPNWFFGTVVLEKTLESPLDCKEMKPVIHWKDWCWSWKSNILAIWCEELILLKRPWCWERLKAEGERDDRGWDVWMASLTQWT